MKMQIQTFKKVVRFVTRCQGRYAQTLATIASLIRPLRSY